MKKQEDVKIIKNCSVRTAASFKDTFSTNKLRAKLIVFPIRFKKIKIMMTFWLSVMLGL